MATLKFMYRAPFEAADELEETLVRSYVSLQSQLSPPYHLSTLSPAQETQLTQALLCGILLNPSAAPSHVTHLTAVTSDGYASFVAILLRIVNESYPKLLEQTRTQILWLFKELIGLTASDVDNLCLSLLRQVAGGDLSPGNVWLAAQLLDVMKESWTWFCASPLMLTTALYTYLRLLPDHAMARVPPLNDLKEKEIAFCVQILRDRFQDCLVIGRDLVRLLQDVTFIPDFEAIWKDLLNNPTSFKALSFADIAQLYVVRTPARYLASRITPDMETQIRFMLTHVRMGNQRRYQVWFAQRFLSAPESETLVCDLIRFICCVHHPSNQILQSDIVPRWAIVGWLLKCCKSNHVEANAKLALFYDWLFFMSKTDNIMNIEPAILLMVYSIPKYVDMTHSLLEFLFLLLEHYDPVRKDLIQKGVTSSIDILVSKGVVRSLEPLSASYFVASWLREKLAFYFSAYCKSDSVNGFKQLRSDLMHQETSYETVHQLVSGVGGKPGQLSGALLGRDQGLGADAQDQETGVENSKAGEADSTSRKRRRLTESLLSEVQSNFEKLADALARSEEAGLVVLERLLWSFLAAGEHVYGDKISKDIRGEVFGDPVSLSGSPSSFVSADSALLSVPKFANQITDVLKKGGYELFGPLPKVPSDRPDADETGSLTSILLRMYVTYARNRPLLLLLLFCWHREGLAVGARLLCFVSRLTEETDAAGTGKTPRLRTLPATSGQDSDAVTGLSSKGEEDCNDSGVNGDVNEAADVADSTGESILEHRKNGLTGGAALRLHGTSTGTLTRKPSKCRDLHAAADVLPRPRTAATDAFKAYEEFLKFVSRASVAHQMDTASSHSQNSTSETSVKVEAEAVDGDNPDAELVSELETCLLWNTYRFLRVLPSVYRYLPTLANGRDDIVQSLVSSLDPQELSNFEFRLLLGEFAIFGDSKEGFARSIKNSLQWEFIEQQILWRLLVAELQIAPSAIVMQVLKICSALVNPNVHSEAQSGLLLLLRYQMPTPQLVNAVLSLPPAFGRLTAVVLASWVSSHPAQLLLCLQTLNAGNPKEKQKKGREDGEDNSANGAPKSSSSAVRLLLSSLDDTEVGKCKDEEKSSRVKIALLKLAGRYDMVGLSSWQASSETNLENHHERKLLS